MRRILAVLVILALIGLLLWLALSGGDDAARKADDAAGPAAAGTEESADPATRGRAKAKSRDETRSKEDPTLPAFMRDLPEIGQDVPQDPKLGAVAGRVLKSPGEGAREFVVEANVRGEVKARARVRGGPQFLLKNVEPSDAVGLTVRAAGYAPGGMDKLVVNAGATLDVGAVYLGTAIDPDVDNLVEVLVVSASTKEPVPNVRVTATSTSYRTLVTLGNLEKVPGATILRATTDAAGRATFGPIPPSKYDFFAESDGSAFEVEEAVLVQKRTRQVVTLALEPGLAIEGKVVTEDEKPVADARVVCLRWGTFTNVPTITTDAEGRFAARNLTAGNYLVIVAKEGLGGKDMQQVPAGKTDLVVVVPQGGDIWVKCVDAATGAPVKEFGVRPYRKQPFAYLYSPLFEAKTEDGIWKTRLLPASDYGIEVSAQGYALNNIPAIKFPMTEPLEVKLEPTGVVRGKVVGKMSGKPVIGAAVFVKRGGFPPSKVKDQQTVTDAEGSFSLPNLPRRAVTITVSHVDHDEKAFPGIEPVAATAEAPPPPVKFELSDGGRVTGKVVSGGAPVAGQKLTLIQGFDFTTIRYATTDSSGTYLFDSVPVAEKYTLTVGDFNPQRAGKSKSDVSVREGETTVVDFGGDNGGATLSGRVVRDEKGVANHPLTLVSSDGGTFQASERTDDTGAFAFEHVPAGKFLLRAGGGSSSKTSDVTILEGEAPAPLSVVLTAGGTVSGKILDGSAQPLAGVWVSCQLVAESTGAGLADLVKRNRGERTTGAEGTFNFNELEDGTYSLRLYRDGFGTEIVDGLVVAGGASPQSISVQMVPACTLSGFVRDSRGVPVEGAAIQVRDLKGRQVFGISFASTEGDGRYTQGGLKAETYDVTAQKDGYAPATQRVTVAAGIATTLDLTLFLGGRMEILVRDSAGAAVADATVVLLDGSGKPLTQVVTFQNILSLAGLRTDATGAVTVSGLAPGTYGVRVTPKGATAAIEKVGVEVTDGATSRVEVVR